MRRWQAVLGYTGAALTSAAMLLLPFVLFPVFTQGVAATGVRVDPAYSGGDLARSVERDGYRILVNRPVHPQGLLTRTAPFVQASTQAPHFMQDMPARPLAIDASSSTSVGHARRQVTQSVHFVRSRRISNTLSLFESAWKGPNGQKNAHCVRNLVRNGSTTKSPANSEPKMANCSAVSADRTSGNSVTALNGHSHMQ